MDTQSIIEQITREAILLCQSCNDEKQEAIKLPANHRLELPLLKGQHPPLPSAQWTSFLEITNGATFFHSDDWPYPLLDNGLRLLNLAESKQEREELLQILADDMSVDLEKHEEAGNKANPWYQGFVPIAAPLCSGDLFVLDTFNATEGQEPPVLFLDHEFYYSGFLEEDDIDQHWPSFTLFLQNFAENPANFVSSTWRILGDDDSMNQFYLENIIYK